MLAVRRAGMSSAVEHQWMVGFLIDVLHSRTQYSRRIVSDNARTCQELFEQYSTAHASHAWRWLRWRIQQAVEAVEEGRCLSVGGDKVKLGHARRQNTVL